VAKLRHERAKVKLLLLLSDGRPLDDQYECDYALEDTRMALLEAKRLGIHPFCVTIDREAPTYLSRMCGEVGFMVVDQVGRLPDCLPHIYRRLTT
jgi:nitric oxide reductase activation protein